MGAKKTENACFKCTERMYIDMARVAALNDMKLSAFIYSVMRQRLYGDIVRLGASDDDLPE